MKKSEPQSLTDPFFSTTELQATPFSFVFHFSPVL